MRRVILGETGIETSCLGFGCASLGSRVSAADGARALAAALDAGVTWIDLAPVYGGGQAEEIAAGVIRGRRDRVQIASKAGLALAGGTGGGLRRHLMPLARKAIGLLGAGAAAKLRGAAPRANARLPLTPALLATSLEASLRRLGTDHLDLFALHGVTAGEVGREEILRALEDLRAVAPPHLVDLVERFYPAQFGTGEPSRTTDAALGSADAATQLVRGWRA